VRREGKEVSSTARRFYCGIPFERKRLVQNRLCGFERKWIGQEERRRRFAD
jgi:hypothetical protein